jgi:hypothetical protein
MRFFLPIVLLAAAASAEVFQFVGQHGHGGHGIYGVRGGVTVGNQQLTGEKTALEYNGTLAIEQVGTGGEYLAKFTQFTIGKYDRINRNIQDESFGNLKPEEQRLVKALHEQGDYQHEMQKPVKFYMKDGQFVRMEAGKEHKQWALNVFRGVFTLLQNQVTKPTNLAVPYVEHKFEDGITGNCKVHYEILSQPEYEHTTGVFNMTKTKNFRECLGRPVYLHLKDEQRGCAGVCDNHEPENFLGQYEEEKTDFEMKPTPGCPANQQRKDSLVSVYNVAKYNISQGYLEEARSESLDIFHLFGGRIQVFTTLKLRTLNREGVKVEQPQNTQTYETLQQQLPTEEDELDIPVYALMKEHTKHQQYPGYFQKHFEAVIRELHQLKGTQKQQGQKEQQTFDTPAYFVELIQAFSGMTEEEIKKTMPTVVSQQQPKQLSEEEHLRRQVWIELLGKAGSKAAVKVATELIKGKTFTTSEVRRVLQDIASFQSYPDTEMIEQVLGLCTKEQGFTATGKATACVAAGKIISKACNSKVYQWAQKEEQKKQHIHNGKYQSLKYQQENQRTQEVQSESEEYQMVMGHLPIDTKYVCTPEKLQQYVQRLSQALQQTHGFKEAVAYINGLSKIGKPEVLPELIGYVNGTAPNMRTFHQQGEDQQEGIEFVRRVAILSLQNVAAKYPKEVNPIVRVIFQNTTEETQTRIIAFDVWMNTQPAQWEVQKVMEVANKDSSVELTHYVYTALKTAMHAKEPCYQLLAQRIRAVWTQIRPFDLGPIFSHLRSKFYYDTPENYGIRGIWKMIASNTTVLPTFTSGKIEQVHGPYMKTLLGAKLLVKGGDKIWEEVAGKDGLLERIAYAINGQVKQGERQHETEQLLKDIAQGMDLKRAYGGETPKAVLFWKFFSGEAILPIDAQYVNELKQELLQTVAKFGKDGVTGHFVRVFFPTKAFRVEPTQIGFPIVHSTIHPVVFSVRYENLKLRFDNQHGRVVPETFELTGTVQPTILSLRQSRVFVAEKVGQATPTMKVSDIKEFTGRVTFRVAYEHGERRFRINVKPHFERVFHSGRCAELKLEKNVIIDEEPRQNVIDYGKCIKTLNQPIRREQQLGGKSGMVVRVTGESHQPWSGLSMFASQESRTMGLFAAVMKRFQGMKHHATSLYLEAAKEHPVTEWTILIDMDSNVERLAQLSVQEQAQKIHKVKVEYKPRRNEQLNTELEQVIRKVEQLLEQTRDQIKETTIERQMLIKIEGRFQGQPKKTIKIAMKKINNFDLTEQKYAIVAEHQESQKGLQLSGNISYPKIGSPLRYDPTYAAEDERMNGTLIAKLTGKNEQVYRINFHATKSEEQNKEMSLLNWFEARCVAEQKAGKTMTDACKKAILKDNSLDRMEMTIQLPGQVHPMMYNVANKFLDMIKYNFYHKMQSDITGHRQTQQHQQLNRGGEQEIRVSANATRQSAWSLLYNVRVEMPRENVTFSQIRLPGLRPVHMTLTGKQQLQHVMYRGQGHNYCVLGDKGVRTYDNVTFGLDVKTGCEYLLTRDQSQGTPDFTVTFQVTRPETFGKKIRVQLFNSIFEFEPFTVGQQKFEVTINGTQTHLTFDKPITFQYAAGRTGYLHAYPTGNEHHGPIVTLRTDAHEFGLIFDGHTAKTIIGNRYKGTVNGICGNNDNEQDHEFIGPQGHEYHHSNEFIAAYGLGQQCKVPAQNTRQQLMETLNREVEQIRRNEQQKHEQLRNKQMQEQLNGHDQQFWQEHQDELFWGKVPEKQQWIPEAETHNQQDNRYVLKTGMSLENGHMCFSITPVPACKPGYHKEGVLRTERVESICLDRNHELAKQGVEDIRQGRLVDVSALEQHQKGRLFTIVNIPNCQRHQ